MNEIIIDEKILGIKKRKFIRKNKCKKYCGLNDIKSNTFEHKKFRNKTRCEIRNILKSNVDKNNYDTIDYQIPNIYKDTKKTWWDCCTTKNKCYSNNKW